MQQQVLDGVVGQGRHGLADLRALAGQEVVDERQDLFAPFAQRRQMEPHHVEAVVEVFAEAAVGEELIERLVGGGNDPDVDLDRVGVAERVRLAGLEEAQQLGLQVGADLADLVEEERAAFVGADDAEEAVDGAGEGAAAVAEEMAVERLARDGGADETANGFLARCERVVDLAREDFLAGAGLAGDEHRQIGWRDAASAVTSSRMRGAM